MAESRSSEPTQKLRLESEFQLRALSLSFLHLPLFRFKLLTLIPLIPLSTTTMFSKTVLAAALLAVGANAQGEFEARFDPTFGFLGFRARCTACLLAPFDGQSARDVGLPPIVVSKLCSAVASERKRAKLEPRKSPPSASPALVLALQRGGGDCRSCRSGLGDCRCLKIYRRTHD